MKSAAWWSSDAMNERAFPWHQTGGRGKGKVPALIICCIALHNLNLIRPLCIYSMDADVDDIQKKRWTRPKLTRTTANTVCIFSL